MSGEKLKSFWCPAARQVLGSTTWCGAAAGGGGGPQADGGVWCREAFHQSFVIPAPFNIPPKATYNPHSTSPCAARFPSVSSCSFMFQKYIIQVHHDCQIFMKIFVSDCDWQRKDGRRVKCPTRQFYPRWASEEDEKTHSRKIHIFKAPWSEKWMLNSWTQRGLKV